MTFSVQANPTTNHTSPKNETTNHCIKEPKLNLSLGRRISSPWWLMKRMQLSTISGMASPESWNKTRRKYSRLMKASLEKKCTQNTHRAHFLLRRVWTCIYNGACVHGLDTVGAAVARKPYFSLFPLFVSVFQKSLRRLIVQYLLHDKRTSSFINAAVVLFVEAIMEN